MGKTQSKPAGKSKGGDKQYDDANRGVLFQNDKDGNEARPDMTGKLVIRASDYEEDGEGNISIRLAAWQKNSGKVGDYLSVSASPPNQGE